ncbi:hypothetical protein GA0070558_103285 [Micromonospora haikouensis]|uniref:Uncharacterized protein n=1 Tax=Micromonospora haikouensis TaxID=686309 RepID=A0A1C4UIS0_9ACTN|nr:hypothetical protein [Micromonospora haikouensis]SCE71593.1 hypothetical protein GA0070558_103285 [Micromonospora haikouensis]
MAITTCRKCGTSNWKSVTVADDGTEAICQDGHWNFERSDRSGGGTVRTGSVRVTGQSAIGSGAVAIGSVSGKKDKKKGRH